MFWFWLLPSFHLFPEVKEEEMWPSVGTDSTRAPKSSPLWPLLVFPSIFLLVLFTSVRKTFIFKPPDGTFFKKKIELAFVFLSSSLLVFEVHLQNIFPPSGCGEKTPLRQGQRECAAASAARRRLEKGVWSLQERVQEDESPGPAHFDILATQLPAAVGAALLNTQIKERPRAQSVPSLFLILPEWILHNRTGEKQPGGMQPGKKIIIVCWN